MFDIKNKKKFLILILLNKLDNNSYDSNIIIESE